MSAHRTSRTRTNVDPAPDPNPVEQKTPEGWWRRLNSGAKALIIIAALVAGWVGLGLLSSGTESSSGSGNSLGSAEVACERAAESQLIDADSARFEYTNAVETASGHTLYGTVTSRNALGGSGTLKFTCQSTYNSSSDTSTATIEIYE